MTKIKSLFNLLRRLSNPYLLDDAKKNEAAFYLAVFFIFILLTFGIRPIVSDLLNLQKNLTAAQKTEKTIKEKITNLNKAGVSLNEIRPDLGLINESLPDDKNLPGLLSDLNRTFGANNFILEGIDLGSTQPGQNPRITALPLKAQAIGGFDDFLSSLRDIERNVRQIDVKEISIEIPEKSSRSLLRITLNLETYFLKEKKIE